MIMRVKRVTQFSLLLFFSSAVQSTYRMRLSLPLALICLLAGQAQSRVLLQGSTQFIQWGLALPGRCRSFPANYNVTLNEALRTDVNSPLKRAYREECQAVIPTYPNQPDAPDSPLPCADYLSPLDDKDYALFRLTVRLDCGTSAGTPPPTDEIQNRLRSLLNKYWNENGTPNQCTRPCGFLEHQVTFASIIRVLGNNVCARSRGAEMKPSTMPPSFGRVPLEQIYPCIGKAPSSPSPSPSSPFPSPSSPSPSPSSPSPSPSSRSPSPSSPSPSPSSPSPSPSSPSPSLSSPSPSPSSPSPSPSSPSPSPSSPSPSPSPALTTCGNTGSGQPFVCVAPSVNKPNNQNITNPSTFACCECSTNTASVEAFDVNGTLVQCLNPADPCPEEFPITVRPFTGTPPVACLARGPNTVCPAGFPFPFFATIGNSTVLSNCWPEDILNSSGEVCQITIASGPVGSTGYYGIPLSASFTSARPFGCLLVGSNLCPSAFPFTNMTATNPVVACFSPQTTCNALGGNLPARFAVRVFSAGTIVGCADISTTCPSAFPIEVSTSTAANPSQCYATNMGCTMPFSFSLYSGNSLERCVQPIPNVANCAGGTFGTFTGAALYSTATASGFTGCASTASCPTALPTFYQSSTGSTERCSPPISTDCNLQFSGQFGTSVRDATTQAIIGCRSGTGCGADDVVVSETVNSPTLQCLAPSTTSCPSGLFPLYSGGSVNGVAKLVRCINAINAQNCDSVGVYTAEVFDNSAGTGPVVGCMTPQGTPCPASSSFATMSDAVNIISCRVASGATCDVSSTKLVDAGGVTVGCITPASDICPTGLAGQAYNYPFFFRGLANGAPLMAECRSNPVPLPTTCDGDFPVEVYGSIVLSSTDSLVGCMRQNQACSVAGFTFTIFTGATGSTVEQCRPSGPTGVAACAAPFPVSTVGVNALVGCATTAVTSCNNNFPFVVFGNAATAPARPTLTECRVRPASNVPVDCQALISTAVGVEIIIGQVQNDNANWIGCTRGDSRCPEEFPFVVFGNAATAPARPTLTECRVRPASNVPVDCQALISTDVGVEIFNGQDQNDSANWIGCTRDNSRCPEEFQIFSLAADGTLNACLAKGTSCTATEISIINSSAARSATPTSPVGCMATGTAGTQTCPIVANEADYSFFVAGADTILVACYLRDTRINSCIRSTSSPTLLNLYRQTGANGLDELLPGVPDGCLLTAPISTCPTGNIVGTPFDFELLRDNQVVGCVDPNGDPTAATTCEGLGRFTSTLQGSFRVMVNNNNWDAVVGELQGCYDGTTTCALPDHPFEIYTADISSSRPGAIGLGTLLRCVGLGSTPLTASAGACNNVAGVNNANVIDRNNVPNGSPYSGTLVGCVTSGVSIRDIRSCPQQFPAFIGDAPTGNVIICQRSPTTCAPTDAAANYFRRVALSGIQVGCTDNSLADCNTFIAATNEGVPVSCVI